MQTFEDWFNTNGDDFEPFLLSVAVDVFESVTFLIDL